MNTPTIPAGAEPQNPQRHERFDRRSLLKTLGGAIAALPLVGCATTSGRGRGVDLGSGDAGLMNYALVLESLETEFYSIALSRPYAGMPQSERRALQNLHDVELVHREFFRRALGRQAIAKPEFDFSRINFNERTSVLMAARDFESTGVAAYNGAANALRDPRILGVAGKIVSVEARHVALLSDLLWPGGTEFAPRALDSADGPRTILRKIDPYVVTKLDGSRLPDA